MKEKFDTQEAEWLLRDQVERAQAVGEIFNNAIESADQATLERILTTHPRKYLEEILGGYPDYLDEELER